MTRALTEHVPALAAAFARGLANQLAPRTLAAIDAQNAADPQAPCASLGWIDPADLTDEAFAAVMGRAPSPARGDDAALIDAAWERARALGYATLARDAEARR